MVGIYAENMYECVLVLIKQFCFRRSIKDLFLFVVILSDVLFTGIYKVSFIVGTVHRIGVLIEVNKAY